MLAFREVLVTPFSDLLRVGPQCLDHRGGPHWPDFERQSEARHRRHGEPVDQEPEPQSAEARISGTWAWGGPITAHFGHQVLEYSMRLVPTLAHDRDARFLFALPPGIHYETVDDAPEFFRAVLDWFGISRGRCHVANVPLLVDELVVAPQAEQLGGPGPSESHLDLMDASDSGRIDRSIQRATVYVSRAGLPSRFAGETSLEEALTNCGVFVMRPETLPLAEQLSIYASARRLIFAEGSAMYGPLLLGRALADVTVLARRAQPRLGRASLRPRATSLSYHQVSRDELPGRNWKGEVVNFGGLTVLEEEALFEVFDALDIPLRKNWDARRYRERSEEDIRRHLHQHR